MTVFEAVKEISCNDAAAYLGLKGKRTSADKGMWCCPFHEDANPSMACFDSDNRFYCFSCHARGDAADLFARVGGCSTVEGARAALYAFGKKVQFGAKDRARGGCDRPRSQPVTVRRELVQRAVQAVREEFRRGMVIFLTSHADGMVAAMDKAPDREGWIWTRARQRACKVQEESARWEGMTDEDIAGEIRESLLSNRVPEWGEDLPTPGRVVFREILDELEAGNKLPQLNLTEIEAVLNQMCRVSQEAA